eukprot:2679110-Rhodomonas_salina.2
MAVLSPGAKCFVLAAFEDRFVCTTAQFHSSFKALSRHLPVVGAEQSLGTSASVSHSKIECGLPAGVDELSVCASF